MTSTPPELSIVVTAHREGPILQTALRTLNAAVEFAEENGRAIEVVIILDRPSEITRAIALSWVDAPKQRAWTCIECDFGNLALSRNEGVKHSGASYIGFLDGDDLFMREWPNSAISFLDALDPTERVDVVVRTEVIACFGRENYYRHQLQSTDFDFYPLRLLGQWHFASNLITSKDLLERFPFPTYDHDNGFGSEDWQWGAMTLEQGVRHLSVENTVYFYRLQHHKSQHGLGAKPDLLLRASEYFFASDSLSRLPHGELSRDESAPHVAKLPGAYASEWLSEAVRDAAKIDYEIYDLITHGDFNERFVPAVDLEALRLHVALVTALRSGTPITKVAFVTQDHDLYPSAWIERFLEESNDSLLVIGWDLEEIFRDNVQFIDFTAYPGIVDLQRTTAYALLCTRDLELVNLSARWADEMIRRYGRALHFVGHSLLRFSYLDDDSLPPCNPWSFANFRIVASSDGISDYGDIPFAHVLLTNSGSSEVESTFCGTAESVALCSFSEDRGAGKQLPFHIGSGQRQNRKSTADLSIVINTHRERRLLVPTLKSLAAATVHCRANSFQVDTILVCDNSDTLTNSIVSDFVREMGGRQFEVTFGNLSESRNFGIEKANGHYIALCDSDDLYSLNWFCRCLEIGPADAVALHPEYNLYFGDEWHVMRHWPSDSRWPELLMFENQWTSLAFASRQTFLDHPFRKSDISNGLGFEDWAWNHDLLEAGGTHEVATETAHYIRRRRGEGLNFASSGCLPLHFWDLFEEG